MYPLTVAFYGPFARCEHGRAMARAASAAPPVRSCGDGAAKTRVSALGGRGRRGTGTGTSLLRERPLRFGPSHRRCRLVSARFEIELGDAVAGLVLAATGLDLLLRRHPAVSMFCAAWPVSDFLRPRPGQGLGAPAAGLPKDGGYVPMGGNRCLEPPHIQQC